MDQLNRQDDVDDDNGNGIFTFEQTFHYGNEMKEKKKIFSLWY